MNIVNKIVPILIVVDLYARFNGRKGVNMKKITALFLAIVMSFTLSGCGSRQDTPEESQGSVESAYTESLDVLNEIMKVYAEEDLFAVYGGDQENAVMDAPGKFDISKTEELDITLGLPEDLAGEIEDAASMVHMMNANTFTGAVYRLKSDTDINAFADSVKANILAKQWICGQPDTLIIIDVDGNYILTAYGNAELIEIFKNNALLALGGSQVITEAPIV